MDSPSLSPKVVTNPAEAGVGSSRQDPGSSAECPDSAEMTGRTVDFAPDTPNQLHPSRERFRQFRSFCKRKATGFKDSAKKVWTRTRKSASGSQHRKESSDRRVSKTSRQAAASSFPNDGRHHSSVTDTDSATATLSTPQAVQPDATVTRVSQTGIMDSGENILATSNTETRTSDSASTLTSTAPVTVQASLADTEAAAGAADMKPASLQSGVAGETDAGDMNLSSDQQSLSSLSLLKSTSDTLVIPVTSKDAPSPSQPDMSEQACSRKEPEETGGTAESSSEDGKTGKQPDCSPAPDSTVMRPSSRKQSDSAPANRLSNTTDSAVVSAAMESIGGETPIHGSASAPPSSPITGAPPSSAATEERYVVNGNPVVNSRPAIAAGKNDMTDQLPGNCTTGNESSKKRGTSPWQSFKNIMSAVGRFISGLISKLISLFKPTKTSKNDSSSGSNPASSSPISTMNTGNRIQIPVQGDASSQEYARPEQEEIGKAEVDPDHIDLSARPSLDSYDYSARQKHGSDKLRKMSQSAGVISSGSPDPVTVIPENSSGNGSNNAPRAPLETADKKKTEQAHSGSSDNPDFQGGAMVDHPIQPDHQQGEDCKSNDTNHQTCPDKQSLAMRDSPDSEKTPDPTGDKIADAPGASPDHLADTPSVQENEDTGKKDGGVKTIPARLRDCRNQAEIHQFIRHQSEEHALLLSAAINEARVFFTDLVDLSKDIKLLENIKLTERKTAANKRIKPIILRMNQTGKTLQEYCNALFKLLNVTSDSCKNTIIYTLLDSAFDPQNECNGQQEEGLNPDIQTLMFFNSCLQEYIQNRSLDQSGNVDITITVKDVMGGGSIGTIASLMLPGFPSWKLALDCTYKTLLSVIAKQVLKWKARQEVMVKK